MLLFQFFSDSQRIECQLLLNLLSEENEPFLPRQVLRQLLERILVKEENWRWISAIAFWVTKLTASNILDPSKGIPSRALYSLISLNMRTVSTAIDSPGTGAAAAPADNPTTKIIRPLKIATFLFRIPFEKLVRVLRDMVSVSLLYLGNASGIASVSRTKSHLSG